MYSMYNPPSLSHPPSLSFPPCFSPNSPSPLHLLHAWCSSSLFSMGCGRWIELQRDHCQPVTAVAWVAQQQDNIQPITAALPYLQYMKLIRLGIISYLQQVYCVRKKFQCYSANVCMWHGVVDCYAGAPFIRNYHHHVELQTSSSKLCNASAATHKPTPYNPKWNLNYKFLELDDHGSLCNCKQCNFVMCIMGEYKQMQ